MRLSWCTDIHLNHASKKAAGYGWDQNERNIFAHQLVAQNPDIILVGGDISAGISLSDDLIWLDSIATTIDKPLAFVTGNHDYYCKSINYVNNTIIPNTLKKTNKLIWLEKSEPIHLIGDTYLIGNSLWADWRNGDILNTNFWLNDYELIEELSTTRKNRYNDYLRAELQRIADEKVEKLKEQFLSAVKSGAKKIICLTHVPPFWEASWHRGQVQDANAAPHFTCRAGEDMFREVMKTLEVIKPEFELIILCGHTHGSGRAKIVNTNITVIQGGAEYNFPRMQEPIDLV